jgi:hypothetical protein
MQMTNRDTLFWNQHEEQVRRRETLCGLDAERQLCPKWRLPVVRNAGAVRMNFVGMGRVVTARRQYENLKCQTGISTGGVGRPRITICDPKLDPTVAL